MSRLGTSEFRLCFLQNLFLLASPTHDFQNAPGHLQQNVKRLKNDVKLKEVFAAWGGGSFSSRKYRKALTVHDLQVTLFDRDKAHVIPGQTFRSEASMFGC